MTTDQPAGPWAAWAAFGEPEGLMPGHVVQLRRAEAAERAEEERRASEAQDRADARYERAVWDARQYSAFRGLAWDPQAPFANMPTVEQRADAMFAAQDLAARQADFKAAQEAGLIHLLHQSPVSSPPSGSSPPPGPAGGTGAATRASILTKIREARSKWSRPRASRSHSLNEPHTVTRFTADANPRIY